MIRIFVAMLAMLVATVAVAAETPVMIGATGGARNSEVCATNSAGGTAVPTTAYAGRKELVLQNLGPNPVFCTFDGVAPLATGAKGIRIEAATATLATPFQIFAGVKVTVKCIAATAAQTTPACLQILELK